MLPIISLFILLIATSFDHLIAGFSIGMEKIKVSVLAMILLSGIGSFCFLLSCLFGEQMIAVLPNRILSFLSTFFFFLLGSKKIIESFGQKQKEKRNPMLPIKFNDIFCIYQNPQAADLDDSKTLSIQELVLLGITLSFDNLTIGMILGIPSYFLLIFITLHFFISFFLFYVGNRISYSKWKTSSNTITFFSGVIFLLIGFYRIFY